MHGLSVTSHLFVAIFLITITLAINLTLNESPANAAACDASGYSESESAGVRTVTFNTASSCTYALPDGVTSISYALVGGGGGGGGGVATGQNKGGSGGRGGKIVEASNVTVTSGATLTLTVGSGGNGGAATKNGVTGSNSLLGISSGASVTALGGNRGARGSSKTNNSGSGTGNGGAGAGTSAAGSGGAGSNNTVNSTTYGGGGGGGASPTDLLGSGGTGGGGGGGTTGSAGTAGTTNTGGGGGGGGGHATATGAGGAGGKGIIVVKFTLDSTAPTVTLAAAASTFNTASISFTVTGNEAIRCSDLSTTDGVDFTLTNMSISSIQQTNSNVCTLFGLSTAAADNTTVRSTVARADTFSIRDLAGNAQTTLTAAPKFTDVTRPTNDTTAPTVLSVSSTKANGSYKAAEVVSIQVNFSEVVNVAGGNPTLTLETGTTDRTVSYSGGTGTNILSFSYTVQAGDTSGDLDYTTASTLALPVGVTIKDGAATPNDATLTLPTAGAAGSLSANKAIVIDTTAPTVSNVSGTSNTYYAEEVVPISVVFSESVNITGTPTLRLNIGASARYAYSQGSSGTSLLMAYTIVCNDDSNDLNYLATNSLELDGGTITDIAGNTATLTLPATTNANSLAEQSAIRVDGTKFDNATNCTSVTPTVTAISSSKTNGSYKAGAEISVQVRFDETVTVTGTPQITLATGGAGRTVNYASGSPGTELTFTYTVQAGDTSTDLDYVGTGSLTLNGGTINLQADVTIAATRTLPTPGASGSLGANSALVIDTTAPTVTLLRSAATSTSATITFTVTGNENITCSTLSTASGTDFTFTNISAITGIVQTSATVCTITATSTATAGGATVNSSLTAAGSFSMTDTAGNAQTTLTITTLGTDNLIAVTVPTTTTTTAAPATPGNSGGGGGGTTTTTTTATTTTTTTVAPITTTTVSTQSTTTTTARATTTTVSTRRTTTTTARATTTTTIRAASTTTVAFSVPTGRRITICHATSSAANPYANITVDAKGLFGHGDHNDDIIPAPSSGCPSGTMTTLPGVTTTISGTSSTTSTTSPFGPLSSSSSSTTTSSSTAGNRASNTLPQPVVPTFPPTSQSLTSTSSSSSTRTDIEPQDTTTTTTTTTLPPGTNTIEINGRAIAVNDAVIGQANDVGPAPSASLDDPTGGRNAFGVDRTSTKRTTLPVLAAERFDSYVPGPALNLEVIGARTTAQFVVALGVSSNTNTIVAALNESMARLGKDFARVDSAQSLTAPDTASLAALADAKSTDTLMSRIFADSELPEPTRLTDLSIPKSSKWLKITGQVQGYVPETVVYLAVTSKPIVFAEAIVDREGNARLVGSFPLDVLSADFHRLRIVGIRQVYGVTLDRQGEMQLSESTIAKIGEFDAQTSATVRVSGPNKWGGYHSAIRVVPLQEPQPWWTLWIIGLIALLALIALFARKVVSRRE